jgi:anaerobic ribonucleoside-triphosphate reductase activating protein
MQPLCPGCQNPATHSFSGGLEIEPEDLAYQIIREAADGTEGITISGGEPMSQAASLYRFICMINAIRPQWDIGLFTGYTVTELQTGHYDMREPFSEFANTFEQSMENQRLWNLQILDRLTWAVFGRFDSSRPTLDNQPHHKLCSSANQHLMIFQRYWRRWSYDDFPARSMEVNIEPDGLVKISGFPPIKSTEGEHA